jgi:hypothetical protein
VQHKKDTDLQEMFRDMAVAAKKMHENEKIDPNFDIRTLSKDHNSRSKYSKKLKFEADWSYLNHKEKLENFEDLETTTHVTHYKGVGGKNFHPDSHLNEAFIIHPESKSTHMKNKEAAFAASQDNSSAGIKLRACIIYFHDSKGVSLNPKDDLLSCRRLASENDVIVINAGYRLAPGFKHPAGEIDAFGVIMWVFDNMHLNGGELLVDED